MNEQLPPLAGLSLNCSQRWFDRDEECVVFDVSRALILFGLAGLAEIGGGWLMW